MADNAMWGDGKIEFRRWETPFENEGKFLDIAEVAFGPAELPNWVWDPPPSLLKRPRDGTLVALIDLQKRQGFAPPVVYKVVFEEAKSFRVVEEDGLLDVWVAMRDMGGLPFGPPDQPPATFCVRNDNWSRESVLSFFHETDDGWSYVIATDDRCLEVLARYPPDITLEQP
jgi:hypothetical protein